MLSIRCLRLTQPYKYHLEYQAYENLAEKEGLKILHESNEKFDILNCHVVHRVGDLAIGEMAVWVGVCAIHRGTAFDACEYIINELKKNQSQGSLTLSCSMFSNLLPSSA